MTITISQAAFADLERLHAFIAENNSPAARRAVGALIEAINSLGSLAERGRPFGSARIRELVVPFGRSAYVVRYWFDEENGEVVVVRVWHGREVRED